MKYVLTIVLLAALFVSAEFNRTSTVIDVPTAHLLAPMCLRFGLLGSQTFKPGIDRHDFDVDFSANMGLPSGFEVSAGIYSSKNILVFGIIKEVLANEKWWLGLGVHELSYTLDVSSVGGGADSAGWDDDVDYNHDDFLKPNENLSLFFVATRNLKSAGEMTLGLVGVVMSVMVQIAATSTPNSLRIISRSMLLVLFLVMNCPCRVS